MIKVNVIKVKVNDLSVAISTDSDIAEYIIRYKFSKFLISARQKCDFHVDLKLVREDWRENDQDRLIINCKDNVYKINFRGFRTSINWDKKKATLDVKPDLEDFYLSVENFLRSIFAIFLHKKGGFLLHAACCIYKNKASVFCGHSGAGKTTLSNLLKSKITILSDDIISVRREDGRWLIQTTPFRLWDAKLGEKSYPLSNIFSIKKSKTFNLRQLNFPETLLLLISSVSFLPETETAYKRIINELDQVAGLIPSYELSFARGKILFDRLIPVISKRGSQLKVPS
jgi:hypothetical protein